MTTELGFFALTQLQKIDRSHPKSQAKNKRGGHQHQGAGEAASARAVVPPSVWIWKQDNGRSGQEDIHNGEESSWEVKAFEEDITNLTWPPRSYACSFCRREFRCAQALGGHMNIHRRLRPKLNSTNNNVQVRGAINNAIATKTTTTTTKVTNDACIINATSPSTFMFMPPFHPSGQGSCHVATTTKVAPLNILSFSNGKRKEMEMAVEMEMEIDLELRLWHRSPSSSTNS